MLNFKVFDFMRFRNRFNFSIGQRIHSKTNGRICSIKGEKILNSVKHFTLSIENEPTNRNIMLSEHALKSEYRIVD